MPPEADMIECFSFEKHRAMGSKKLQIAVILLVVGALSVRPSLSFAARMGTACNIFYVQPNDKAGPCHHQAFPLKDKHIEVGFAPIPGILFEVHRFLMPRNPLFIFLVSSADLRKVTPLRC